MMNRLLFFSLQKQCQMGSRCMIFDRFKSMSIDSSIDFGVEGRRHGNPQGRDAIDSP